MKTAEHISLAHTLRGNTRTVYLFFVLFILAGIFCFKNSPVNLVCIIFPKNPDILRVAHAGGGIEGETYTNSIQAMDLNYSNGFRFFEIDFSTTSDNKIVCVHDWVWFRKLAKKDELDVALSFAEFEELNEQHFIHKRCTLESLADWFSEHKDAFLITDIKDNNLKSLEMILNRIPNSNTVVIPQIYTPDEYDWVNSAGVEKVIWSLYKSPVIESHVLNNLENMERVIAVTMPVGMTESGFPVKILWKGVSVYSHAVNDPDEYKRLTEQNCVSEIYTSFLKPEI